jgi:hypothetical protein
MGAVEKRVPRCVALKGWRVLEMASRRPFTRAIRSDERCEEKRSDRRCSDEKRAPRSLANRAWGPRHCVTAKRELPLGARVANRACDCQ